MKVTVRVTQFVCMLYYVMLAMYNMSTYVRTLQTFSGNIEMAATQNPTKTPKMLYI